MFFVSQGRGRRRTPRSAHEVSSSSMDFQHLKLQNEEMQAELLSLRKVADALRDGGKILLLYSSHFDKSDESFWIEQT